MSDHRENDTIDREVVLRETTKLDLKTAMMLGGLAVGLVINWGQVNLSMVKMDAELRAAIIAAQTKSERETSYVNGLQDTRARELENQLDNINAMVCAIARKLDVPNTGCPR